MPRELLLQLFYSCHCNRKFGARRVPSALGNSALQELFLISAQSPNRDPLEDGRLTQPAPQTAPGMSDELVCGQLSCELEGLATSWILIKQLAYLQSNKAWLKQHNLLMVGLGVQRQLAPVASAPLRGGGQQRGQPS